MRLTAIKMSGFKSFVDPLTVEFPDHVTAVVGPNGCGKSNIIDAVRWVMGELSAKQLRGEQMSDVIFNGSADRKPVGMANVELLFDNSDGRAGGEYANYNEISVRRQVSRDGSSMYYLNGTRCRRKDITDLFLGTGLGSRSYSIIEQGMISEIVEARPEDLRQHLEEAAGISKYRERRRETENRMRHTRENLERLRDLREEVENHLRRLQSQARAAERYKKLQQQKRELQARLRALELRRIESELARSKASGGEDDVKLQEALADQRRSEAALELLREQQNKAQEHANAVQAHIYEHSAKMGRLEQSIRHQRDIRSRQEKEFEELQQRNSQYQELHASDAQRLQELRTQIERLEPEHRELEQQNQQQAGQLRDLQLQCDSRQRRLDEIRQIAADRRQQLEVLRTRIQANEQQTVQDREQSDRLQSGIDPAAESELDGKIKQAAAELAAAETGMQQLQEQHESARRAVAEAREQRHRAEERLRECQAEIGRCKAEWQSLQALQQAALGRDRDSLQQWLEQHRLAGYPRLAELISSEERWATAVERVLADFLQAVMIERIDDHAEPLAAAADNVDDGDLVMVHAGSEAERTENRAQAPETLADHATAPPAVTRWLQRIRCAGDIHQALRIRTTLAADESVITPKGEWLAPDWACIGSAANPAAGSLERQQKLRALESHLTELEQVQQSRRKDLQQANNILDDAESRLERLRQDDNAAHARKTELAAALQGLRERQQVQQERREELDRRREELGRRMAGNDELVRQLRRQAGELSAELEQTGQSQQRLNTELEQLLEQRDRLQEDLRNNQQREHELAVRIETSRAAMASAEQALERGRAQSEEASRRRDELQQLLAQDQDPGHAEAEQLEQLGKEQLQNEKRLKDARVRVEELAEQIREVAQQNQQLRQQAESLRERVAEARLQQQSLQIKADHLRTEIRELVPGEDIDQLLAGLPDDAVFDDEAERLQRLENRITRMEPINLAAIGEFEQEQQRKQHLDSQNEDLEQALATLEQAIGRIDKTTRTRFRDTFDRVNQQLEILFPRLFGGGHAHIELVGDDWLNAGISIMARPPGKRITSLHLLSGGEKAMTAVAFVFSLFELNPAPFCLLDEVDAPLDDANVVRFASLVREMSERVQFVIVTHNKITMEMADRLCGVTMREAGVSRLVAVDIEQAAGMAAAG